MEDQNQTQGTTGSSQKPADVRGDLTQELKELAETLEKAVRGVASSQRAKELEQELRQGIVTLRQQTESALRDAKVPEAAQEFGSQAKRVAGEATKSKPMQDALGIITRGLAALNQRLERYVETGDTGAPTTEAGGAASGPIETAVPPEPPADAPVKPSDQVEPPPVTS